MNDFGWLRRSTSLRTRVAIAAALAAGAVIAVFAVVTSILVSRNDTTQLDRRLDAIIESSLAEGGIRDVRRVAFTARSLDTGDVIFERGYELPPLPVGTTMLTLDGVDYRVRTLRVDSEGGALLSVGIRIDSLLLGKANLPVYLIAGAGAVLVGAGLGWLFAGPAVRPLRRLTAHTRGLGKEVDTLPEVKGMREAEDLYDAMSVMLQRLADAQTSMRNSLQTAQDFAASAAHELRTPLTAMRADLDTLRMHDLPAEERAEVVADLSRAQRRVEALITALGQLASGELAQAEDREMVDIGDLLERVAVDAMRQAPEVEISVPDGQADYGTVWAWASGLRLALDNLVRNSVAHGRAGRITLSVSRRPGEIAFVVDDDGCGLPSEERREVLRRFKRGSTAATGGSGLGLALVAQQAAMHDGTIELSDGPLGGLRATLTVPAHDGPPASVPATNGSDPKLAVGRAGVGRSA